MLDIAIFTIGAIVGAGGLWLAVRGKISRLSDITDRDALGRFVKRDK